MRPIRNHAILSGFSVHVLAMPQQKSRSVGLEILGGSSIHGESATGEECSPQGGTNGCGSLISCRFLRQLSGPPGRLPGGCRRGQCASCVSCLLSVSRAVCASGDVAAVALCQNVFAHGGNGLAGDDLGADRCL